MHRRSVAVFDRFLAALATILEKAEAHCEARKIKPEVILAARLFPDMFPFTRQVQLACDFAARGTARLAGVEPKGFPDTETSFAELKDRSKTVEQRLIHFYDDYYAGVTTRHWLRLFLYASLAEMAMAPAYIAAIVTQMLEIIVAEAAHEQGLELPDDPAVVQEIGWILHGAVSHLAIRRHVYANTNPTPVHAVLQLQVRNFLAGLPAVLGPSAAARR